MRYVAKSECESLEATRFELACASYVAVAVDGRVHAIPAEVFDLLYEQEREKPAAPATPQAIDRSAVGKPKPAAAAGATPGATSRVLELLRLNGPQTHAELAERVYPELISTQRGQRLWGLMHPLKTAGKVHKIEHNGLDKWALVESEAA